MLFPTSEFKKKFGMLPRKLQDKVEARLRIFESDPFSPILNNHALHGEYEGSRSINITGDLRVVYSDGGKNKYILHNVGTHSQLYE